ncbi:MAG: QueT transporter family protein [Acholeplasma sp.]|nr:QueT transporter family protein [Acholeplasma sp.]
MQKFTTKDLAMNAIIGAFYIALVFIFSFLSFEIVQFRIAEVLLVLVLFNPRLSIGLILGTFLANLISSPFGLIDALVGTSASLVAIIVMIIIRKKPLVSLLMPAIFNGLIVGYMIYYLSLTDTVVPFYSAFLWVFLGEFVVLYLLGIPLYFYIQKHENIHELIS